MVKDIRLSLMCIAIISLPALASCQPPPPRVELERFQLASSGMLEATRDLAEMVGPKERLLAPKAGDPGQTTHLLPFRPEDASYYASIGDPPVATHLKHAAEALDGFNRILVLYAEGRSWDLAAPRIDEAVNSATAIVGLLPAGVPGMAGSAAALPGGKAVFSAFATMLRRITDRQRFRELVSAEAPTVHAVIGHLRQDISPLIHALLQQNTNNELKVRTRQGGQSTNVIEAAVDAKRHIYRELVANWVLLLNHTEYALSGLESAVATGTSDAEAIAFWATEASIAATQVSTSIIALNKLP